MKVLIIALILLAQSLFARSFGVGYLQKWPTVSNFAVDSCHFSMLDDYVIQIPKFPAFYFSFSGDFIGPTYVLDVTPQKSWLETKEAAIADSLLIDALFQVVMENHLYKDSADSLLLLQKKGRLRDSSKTVSDMDLIAYPVGDTSFVIISHISNSCTHRRYPDDIAPLNNLPKSVLRSSLRVSFPTPGQVQLSLPKTVGPITAEWFDASGAFLQTQQLQSQPTLMLKAPQKGAMLRVRAHDGVVWEGVVP